MDRHVLNRARCLAYMAASRFFPILQEAPEMEGGPNIFTNWSTFDAAGKFMGVNPGWKEELRAHMMADKCWQRGQCGDHWLKLGIERRDVAVDRAMKVRASTSGEEEGELSLGICRTTIPQCADPHQVAWRFST
jgi:hypothetical protein